MSEAESVDKTMTWTETDKLFFYDLEPTYGELFQKREAYLKFRLADLPFSRDWIPMHVEESEFFVMKIIFDNLVNAKGLDYNNEGAVFDWFHEQYDAIDDAVLEGNLCLVKHFGGEDHANKIIDTSWNCVSLPQSQIWMIRLLEEAGYVQYCATSEDAGGSGGVVSGGASNASGGVVSGGASNASGGAGNFTEGGGGPFHGGDDSSDGSSGSDGDNPPPKKKKFKLITLRQKIFGALLIENQRGDAPAGKKNCRKINVRKDTSIGCVKKILLKEWGVPTTEQSFWRARENKTEELRLDDSCLIKDHFENVSSSPLLFLRHKTLCSRLSMSMPCNDLPSHWPLLAILQSLRSSSLGLSYFSLKTPEVKSDVVKYMEWNLPDLDVTLTSKCKLNFLDTSRNAIELMILFSLEDNVQRFKGGLTRGYFVESFELDLGGKWKLKNATPSTLAPVQLQTGKATAGAVSFGIGASGGVVDGAPQGNTKMQATRSRNWQKHKNASSEILQPWGIKKRDHGWSFWKILWDEPWGDPGKAFTYPDWDLESGKIPSICTLLTTDLEAELEIPDNHNFLSQPSLKAYLLGNGEKEERDEKATIPLKVKMKLRKLRLTNSRLNRRYKEYSDSYREVVMERTVHFCQFPDTITGGCLLVAILIGVLALIFTFLSKIVFTGEISFFGSIF